MERFGGSRGNSYNPQDGESFSYNPQKEASFNIGPNPFNREMMEVEELRREMQKKLDEGISKKEILEGIDRPVDKIRQGREVQKGEDPFRSAVNAQFGVDYGKMDGFIKYILRHSISETKEESDDAYYYPEKASGDTYYQFFNKYPTAVDFVEKYAKWFVEECGKLEDSAQGLKLQEDVIRLGEMAYGKQWTAMEMLANMNPRPKEAKPPEPESFLPYISSERPVSNNDLPEGTVLPSGYEIVSEGYPDKSSAYESYRNPDGSVSAPGNTVERADDGRWYWVKRYEN